MKSNDIFNIKKISARLNRLCKAVITSNHNSCFCENEENDVQHNCIDVSSTLACFWFDISIWENGIMSWIYEN